ncbi:DUF1674 domain-containing protein [Nitratireductor mangrovi]|uniref:DUF1674 domain-containing protein n=2 Tax=Nitratireductor mangrovi TaxID=2599600 RepID=A0A5B8KW92_9HYPH|nr:DUF1674 domain-containing protein [Nitratireductor mangrovi]
MMGRTHANFNLLSEARMPASKGPETGQSGDKSATGHKKLPPHAERALAEAQARRDAYRKAEAGRPKEVGGRDGLEPARYGDWEVKGIASDF